MAMKKTTAANLALGMAALGWAMCYLGLFAHLGDPNPAIPRETIEAEDRFYWMIFFAGAMLAVGAMWFAGFGYAEARIRSIIAASLLLLPLSGLAVWMAMAA